MDLVQTGESVDTEKDFCLERFMTFAKNVTDRLIAAGHWADYIDPCSGLSMVNKDSQQIYGEVDALVTLLNYQTTNSGCCKVVLHPTWGSAVYPASIFTKAPAALATPSPRQKRKFEPRTVTRDELQSTRKTRRRGRDASPVRDARARARRMFCSHAKVASHFKIRSRLSNVTTRPREEG